ncbi:twin-arginine translocase subunit TatC [Bacillus massiliigorillae]|uniref:twin-arginine translocase subunit TatC n=1 Tax=Bacillus massiliigorillae TaxID=1243664 RepID=UPI00039A9FCB|nr:twin-arginine translocase subunit TatC [Bacillus massiliigorillae]
MDENWIEHLEELRKRLIFIAVAFIISLIIGFAFSNSLLEFLKVHYVPEQIQWNVFGFTDGFLIYFKLSFLISLILSFPIAIYQIWAFVKPGLTEKEAKGTLLYVPLSFFLFIVGLSFSFFIVFPMTLNFMSNVNSAIGAIETYGLQHYFTFMFNVVIPISLVFELPVVILFLTKLGIINPTSLKKVRKYAYFLLIVIGVTLTPPDFISDFLVIIPLILLYEISIWISAKVYKQQIKKEFITENS